MGHTWIATGKTPSVSRCNGDYHSDNQELVDARYTNIVFRFQLAHGMGCIVVVNRTSPSRRLAAGLGVSALVVLGTATSALVAVTAPTPAAAQGFFSIWDAPKPRKVRKAKAPRPSNDTEESKLARVVPARSPNGPLVINVSIRTQRVTVYDRNGVLAEAPVSTGRVGYPTPTGVFTVIEKDKVHFSNLYGSAPMPNMQRIT